jgi:hypothetical protein
MKYSVAHYALVPFSLRLSLCAIINLTNLVWEGGSWKNCHPNSLFHLLKPGAILIIMLPQLPCACTERRRANCTARHTHAHIILCTLRETATDRPERAHVFGRRIQNIASATHACRVTGRWQNHKNLIWPLCCWRANDALFIFPAIMCMDCAVSQINYRAAAAFCISQFVDEIIWWSFKMNRAHEILTLKAMWNHFMDVIHYTVV